MRRRKDGTCHNCMNPAITDDGYCQAHQPTGRQLADEGGQRALTHAELEHMDWGDRAFRAMRIYIQRLQRGDTFTVERILPWAYSRGLPQPPAKGAWGPITKRIKKAGLIEFARHEESKNPTQHGKPIKVWRVL